MKVSNPFKLPSPGEVAQRELHKAELELLNAHTNLEACRVEMKSCEAHIGVLTERIKRLSTYLANG